MVDKLVADKKRKAWTVPYVVRQLSGVEWARLRDSPKDEAERRKQKLMLKVKDAVPHGRHPCDLKSKGVGWCQVTIMKESAELSYHIFGMYKSLTIDVTSLRKDGKVQVWAQGEKYDPTENKMKLQPDNEGWSFLITTSKAQAMIRNNRANWLKYNVAMVKEQEKEDQKRAKKRMGPAARSLLRLHRGPVGPVAGDTVSTPGKRAKKAAVKKSSPASKSPLKRARRSVTRSASASSTKSVMYTFKNKNRKLRKQVAEKKKEQKHLFGQSHQLTVLEQIVHCNKSWAHNVQTLPHEMVDRIFNVFKITGNVDLLFTACMRLLHQVDDGVKQREAKFFRQAVQEQIRSQLDKNNKSLNELKTEIAVRNTVVEGFRRPVVVSTSAKTTINLAGSSSSDTEKHSKDDKETKGPAKDAKQSKGPRKEPAAENVKGPKQTDFTQADADFEATRAIPKTKTARAHFRKCYPYGYPDDKDFVQLAHYRASKRRSASGYQSVGLASAQRREKWRVKMDDTTVGRYNKKAEACEVVYWQLKQAREMAEYASDSFPTDMLS